MELPTIDTIPTMDNELSVSPHTMKPNNVAHMILV